MIIELKNKELTAKIDSKGAELISLKNNDGIEYMWQKDAKFWGRSSPVLFPIVGNLKDNKAIIEGKEYTMSKHGFCRDAEFTVTSQNENSVSFNYSYNEETLKLYPYKFSLTMVYTLNNDKITITYSFKNTDSKDDMYFCFGAHPAFNVPLTEKDGNFEDFILEFNKNETEQCPIYDLKKSEFNVNNRFDLLKGKKELNLSYSYFDEDAIVFDKPQSTSVKLYSSKTKNGVEVDFKDFDFLAFWTPIKASAPFLCIEPWCGMACCSDETDYDYTKKRGIKKLNPLEEKSFDMTIKVL